MTDFVTVNTYPNTSDSGCAYATGNQSIQMIFAELQGSLAQMNKDKATEMIDEIRYEQARSREYAELINELRAMSDDIENNRLPELPTDPDQIAAELERLNNLSPQELEQAKQLQIDIEAYRQALREGKNAPLPTTQEGIDEYRANNGVHWYQALRIREYCIKNGIQIDPTMTEEKLDEILKTVQKCDPAYKNALKAYEGLSKEGITLSSNPDVKQVQGWIQSIQNIQDQCGSDIQQQMIYVQDFIGQYNSYMQGANSAINLANQTLTSIARGQ